MDNENNERPGVEPLYYFAILSLMLLWIQGERTEVPPPNQHTKPQTVWDSASLHNSHLVIAHMSPNFVTPTTVYMSRNKFIYTIQPTYTFKEDLHSFPEFPSQFQLNIQPVEKQNQLWITSSYSTAHNNASFCEIISILPDRKLYKKLELPGCHNTSQGDEICYLSLIRLPKEECNRTKFGCLNQSNDEIDDIYTSSWTCSSNPNIDNNRANNFCIELISSSSIEGIYNYANLRNSQIKNEQLDNNFCLYKSDDKSSIEAGKVLSFCANPLFHSLAIDPDDDKLFFIQSTTFDDTYSFLEKDYLDPSDYNYQKLQSMLSNIKETRLRLLFDDGNLTNFETNNEDYRELQLFDDINTQFELNIDSTIHSMEASCDENEVKSQSSLFSTLRNLEHINTTSNSFEYSKVHEPLILPRSCISAISLDTHYMDLTQCVNLPTISSTSLPVHLIYEEFSKKLVALSFDQNRALLVSVLNKYTHQVQYSMRFNHFHSGWFFTHSDENNGYLIIIKDGDMLTHTINAINLTKGKVSSSHQSTGP